MLLRANEVVICLVAVLVSRPVQDHLQWQVERFRRRLNRKQYTQMPSTKSRHSRKCVAVTLALLATAKVCFGQIPTPPELHWYRGSTHTHTRGGDVDGTPDFVARWYREHSYQFVVITDHEFVTDVDPLNALFGKPGQFLLMRGQEVTQIVSDPTHPDGLRHAHVNAINPTRVVMPITSAPVTEGMTLNRVVAKGITMTEAYTRNMVAIRAAGGIPQVNHPNYQWSARLDDLLPVPQAFLLEVWNGYPTSNNLGGVDEAGHVAPSAEALWDALLSKGRIVWGIASDDSHTYHQFDDREAPTPGKAWVMVRAAALTAEAITDALQHGHFYASTGVTLQSYTVSAKEIAIKIQQPLDPNPIFGRATRYMTRFVGIDGRVLAEMPGLSLRYGIRGDEQYVRASIIDSDGRKAWTQPVFLDDRKAGQNSVGDRHPGYCGDSR